MDFTRHRGAAALVLLTVGIAFAAAAGLHAGDQGGPVLLVRLGGYVVLLGWLALSARVGAVLLWPAGSPLRLPRVAALLVPGVPLLLLAGFVCACSAAPRRRRVPGRRPAAATAGWSWSGTAAPSVPSGSSASTRADGPAGQESREKPRRVRSGTRSSAATAAAPSVTVS
ncbi:hypothetical protein ACFWUZ_21565 [Streptomyces sp. NPDC058646]|uniref:hypothetical protein n=1 Tax=Streptomyces sp. NPDC058646 TaxID=3346574 RepID=UPI003656343F